MVEEEPVSDFKDTSRKENAVPEDSADYKLSKEQEFRKQRNFILFQTDWTQLADAPVDQAAWAEYRQELRDLPENTVDFDNVVWPTPPSN